MNKTDRKVYQRTYRQRHPQYDQKYNAENIRRARELKKKLVEYKGNTCNRCGQSYHPACFDFHHIDPSKKDYNISNLALQMNLALIYKELDKCVMLCANCHRLTHAEIGAYQKKEHKQDNQLLML